MYIISKLDVENLVGISCGLDLNKLYKIMEVSAKPTPPFSSVILILVWFSWFSAVNTHTTEVCATRPGRRVIVDDHRDTATIPLRYSCPCAIQQTGTIFFSFVDFISHSLLRVICRIRSDYCDLFS